MILCGLAGCTPFQTRGWHAFRSRRWMMQPQPTSPSHLIAVPGLDDLEADLALADSLPVSMLAERARRAARLAADLQTALIARAACREASSEPDRLLAIPKVAEILEFTEQYVYELIRRGHLPAVRSGKYVRVSASAIENFMKNGPAKSLDRTLYHGYSGVRGRTRASPAKDARPPNASDPRRPARRRAKHRGPMGAERALHHGADDAANPNDARTVEPDA